MQGTHLLRKPSFNRKFGDFFFFLFSSYTIENKSFFVSRLKSANIVTCHGVVKDGEKWLMVTEFCKGKSLRHVNAKKNKNEETTSQTTKKRCQQQETTTCKTVWRVMVSCNRYPMWCLGRSGRGRSGLARGSPLLLNSMLFCGITEYLDNPVLKN